MHWKMLRLQRFAGILITCALLLVSLESGAQGTINFSSGDLQGVNLKNPTSLQFGPDGRLYVSQQNGLIYALLIQRNGVSDYMVVDSEVIDLVQNIPNYNDDVGDLNTAVTTRQVTGILVAGTSANPILYVTSSDPRIGAGGGGEDLNLDTNSGILSKLTWVGATRDDAAGYWDKVDLVRGLPRSEENHSSNGLHLSATGDTLFIAQGGNTNAGAPSNNFAFQTEYALAAAILSVDLPAIESLPVQGAGNTKYIYDLPTLDDPTRPNANGIEDPNDASYTGVDVGDPFGGNDGLNQAKLVEGGPVQVHASGFRNAYDLEITSSAGQDGRMYVIDNGPNGGWGGHPAGEADYPGETTVGQCTNEYLTGEPGSTGPGPGGDLKVNNKDNLHYVRELTSGEKYYGGHPAPIRGNPEGAGIYKDSVWVVAGAPSDTLLPPDWPAVPASMAYAAECDYRNPGTDGSLAQYDASTNGIVEYTASNLDGVMQGNLLLASFDGNIYRVELNGTGDAALVNESFASGFGSTPLDVTAQGDGALFGGTVWAATYGSSGITVFEPADYDGNTVPDCSGAYDATLDEDGDGYTNADEIDNGTNPCSGASKPVDFDGDLVSDLNDSDDDDDGIADLSDMFAIDASNGLDNSLPISYNLFNNDPGTGFFGVGFTGLMVNGTTNYLNQFSQDSLIAGGTAGIFTITDVPGGTSLGSQNDQRYAFQFGAAVDQSNAPFSVEAQMNGPFFDGMTPQDFQSQGIYVGTGDQDNYVKVVLNANGGAGGIQVVAEEGGVVSSSTQYAPSGLLGASNLKVFLTVDPSAGTVQPSYAIGTGSVTELGSPIALDPAGPLLTAVQSTDQAVAVGVLATSREASSTFGATWDYVRVAEDVQTSTASVAITPNGDINASAYSSGAFTINNTSSGGEAITSVRLDLSTAAFPDMVFDPNGEAGDSEAKGFTPDAGGSATGLVDHTLFGFHNGVDASDGYDVLEITFSDFQPGESFSFSIDVDPNSIKGTSAPGPGESGSVSGLELVGSTVDVMFDDGLKHAASLFRGPDASTVSGGSNAIRSGAPAKPSVEIVGLTELPATVTEAQQTVRVSGPVNANVRLLVLEGALFEPSTGAYNAEPYDANSVLNVQEYAATLDASGQADVDIALTKSDPSGGYHYIIATVAADDGMTGSTSDPAVLSYEPQALTTLYRINAGGGSYTDVDGNTWSADNFSTGGKTYSDNVNIGNTDDDAVYQSERYGDHSYNIPVEDGTYAIQLHFAEIYWGVKKGNGEVGDRVFNVDIENGQAGLTDYDIIADVGAPATAVVKSFSGIEVTDGELNINFSTLVDNAKVSAIEVLESYSSQYTIAVNTSGSGSVTKTPDQSSYALDDVVEVTAVPDAGWAFDSWSGDVTGTTNPASLTVSGNMSVTATFVPTYTLAVNTVGEGTVSLNPDKSAYLEGESVELIATPASGWLFEGWSGDLVSSSNPDTINITSNSSVIATFIEQPTAANFTASLRVEDAAQHAQALTFGTGENATNGFDEAYDEKAPPAPPSGAFDARFKNPNDGTELWTDVRSGSSGSGTLTWQVHFQAASGAAPIKLEWNADLLPAGMFRLQDLVDGTQVNVNMKTRDEYVVESGSALQIVYTIPDPTTLASYDANHASGWNLIGMPLDIGPMPYTTVFPAAESETLFGFKGASYERGERFQLGQGYWLEFSSSGTQTVDGYPTSSVELALSTGWNLITGPSSCAFPLPLTSEQDPSGVVTTVYAFANGAYALADSLKPADGYWMQASTAGLVTLDCSTAEASSATMLAAKAQSNKAAREAQRQVQLRITDEAGAQQTLIVEPGANESGAEATYAVPPRPPRGAFDVRFDDDTRRSTSVQSEVLVQTKSFPVTIEASGSLTEDESEITVLYGSTPGATYTLRNNEPVRLTDEKMTGLLVSVGQESLTRLPEAFALHSNYPNPVVTTTEVAFDLPEAATIILDVYNVLGQRVQRLGPRSLSAGAGHTLRIDASAWASGVYFYRLTAEMASENVSDVGKMVVAK
jgi:hypothetical protein